VSKHSDRANLHDNFSSSISFINSFFFHQGKFYPSRASKMKRCDSGEEKSLQRSHLPEWMSIGRLTAICLFFLGCVIAVSSLSYEIGTLRRMGAGYFPMILGLALCVIAAAMFFDKAQPLVDEKEEREPGIASRSRALLFPLGGILAFVSLIELAGFAPALFFGAVLAGLADPENSLIELCIIGALVTGFATLVFVYALGIPVQLVAF
jgi:hypothetical protein